VTRIWVHENTRVFGDRLIDTKDRKWLDGILIKEACDTMSLEKDILLNAERLIFGDYMEGIEAENRVYAQISDTKILVEKVIEFLDEYNN